MTQNTRRRERWVEKPQRRNTESVDPSVETRMQVVMCQRSVIQPMITQPKTVAMLIRISVRAETLFDAPRLFAYVGR